MDTLNNLLIILLGIATLGILIIIHEFGHLVVGLILKAKPKTFAIGFGKKLYSTYVANIEFTINAIPLGGYVDFATTQFPQIEKEKEAIAYWKWILISLAGPLANILTSWLILLAIMMSIYSNVTIYKNKDITQKNIIKIEKEEELIKANFREFAILYNNKVFIEKEIFIKVDTKKLEKSHLSLYKISYYSAMKANESLLFITTQYIKGIAQLFKKSEYEQLSGPIGIIHQFKQQSKSVIEALSFVCFLSFAIGFFNLLPFFTILDGGRIVIALVQSLIGDRKFISTFTLKMNHISLIFFLIMFVYTTVGDLFKLF